MEKLLGIKKIGSKTGSILSLIIILLSCMNISNEIDISERLLKTNFNGLMDFSDRNDSEQKKLIFKKVDNYLFFNNPIESIKLIQDSIGGSIREIKLKINSSLYDKLIDSLYDLNGKPKFFLNKKSFKDTLKTETMIWKSGKLKRDDYDENKLKKYDLLGWDIKGNIIFIYKPKGFFSNENFIGVEIKGIKE